MNLKRFLLFILILFLIFLIAYFYNNSGKINTNAVYNTTPEEWVVTKVVDGDTIHIKVSNGSEEIIRLLGVNTPEKNKYYYSEAKNFLSFLENKTVFLEKDSEDLDKYGRKLRYVFYDSRIINIEIIENGFATLFMINNLKYKDKFIRAENFAISNQKGLWEKSSDSCSSCIKLVLLNLTEDYFIIRNNCSTFCNLSGWEVKDDANHFFKITSLEGYSEKKYDSKNIWNDNYDRFFMRDSYGKLVIYKYQKNKI